MSADKPIAYRWAPLPAGTLERLEQQKLQQLMAQLCERLACEENTAVEAWLARHVDMRNVFSFTLVSFPHRPGYFELHQGDEVIDTLQLAS